MKKTISILILLALLGASMAAATEKEVNLSNSDASLKRSNLVSNTANLVANALKYDPYPVNAGDWVTVWIKVENIGTADATNAQFTLDPQYPFSAEDNLTQSYGSINGKTNALTNRLPDESTLQSNQVLLKYRVKVDESAPEGTSTLRFITTTTSGYTQVSQTYNLPIEIRKTKTDFDAAFQNYNYQRITYAVSNTGDKAASAVAVSVKNAGIVDGPSSIMIGNMNPGEFTTVSFMLKPNQIIPAIDLEISYTDEAGTRNAINKTIPAYVDTREAVKTAPESALTYASNYLQNYTYWIFAFAGVILGIVISIILSKKK